MTRPTPALDRAVDWLSQILLREQRASTILRLAARAGIRRRTLRRAKRLLGIRSVRGKGGVWLWIVG